MKIHKLSITILIFFLFLLSACAQHDGNLHFTQKKLVKTALIIGNNSYENVPLKNPKNDARAIAVALSKLGFDIELILDTDKAQLKKSIDEYLLKIKKRKGVSFFYYAGHGAQFDGNNYLLPTDIMLDNKIELTTQSLDLNFLVAGLKQTHAKSHIIVLDACRNNPFLETLATKHRGISIKNDKSRALKIYPKGLSKIDAPSNTFIAFSTAPGKLALDGDDSKNSYYTKALVNAINKENYTVEQVFKEVRIQVIDETDGYQIPWESSSLTQSFFFKPKLSRPTGW